MSWGENYTNTALNVRFDVPNSSTVPLEELAALILCKRLSSISAPNRASTCLQLSVAMQCAILWKEKYQGQCNKLHPTMIVDDHVRSPFLCV